MKRLCCIVLLLPLAVQADDWADSEVLVFSHIDEIVSWFESEDFWGEMQQPAQLDVPYVVLTGINDRWHHAAQNLPVPEKKQIFYRFMLPLVLHANQMVLDRRAAVTAIGKKLKAGGHLSDADFKAIRDGAVLLRVIDADEAARLNPASGQLGKIIEELLYRLDVIPTGLVLGQAAYESGYGTSRFAAEGNALFGQWSYGGTGLVPEQQRKSHGDHRITAFDWPFDSVRAYFINLMSHPAYEDFRKLRADVKASGRAPTSLELADGLSRYSERGQEYVDTLKGIIRVNKLDHADEAVLRDEAASFVVVAEDDADARRMRGEIEAMRANGELEEIISRMRLE
jgi:uncharacterized FlgJ-related protein